MSSKLYIGDSQATPSIVVEKQVPMPLSIQKIVDSNGKLVSGFSNVFPLPENVKNIDMYGLAYLYKNNKTITNINFGGFNKGINLTENYSLQGCFESSSIVSCDMSNIVSATGLYTMNSLFQSCSSLVSVNLSNLKIVTTQQCIFQYSSIQNVNLDSLEEININCTSWFFGATNIEILNLPSLKKVKDWGMSNWFNSCYSIKNVYLPALEIIEGEYALGNTFSNCTKLENVYFGGIKTSTLLNNIKAFAKLFGSLAGSQAPNGCTLHLPSNFDPSNPDKTFDITTLDGYPTFGGNANYIHLTFDLPATE